MTKEKSPKNTKEQQAQALMLEYLTLPVELQKLYVSFAMPVAQVAYGVKDDK